ncbi:protein O-mannosyl-transferase [Gammaproteobacteria bacterium]
MSLSFPYSSTRFAPSCQLGNGNVCLALLIVITVAIYLPGLSGLFMFDDEQNITNQRALQMDSLTPTRLLYAALSSDSGPLKRPVSMVSFALNAYITGLDPYPFKAVNLAIHVINGILIYVISLLFFQIYRRIHAPQLPAYYTTQVALAISAAWLLHPINLSTVLYVVQRMTGLSALFSLIGMAFYLLGRQRQMDGGRGMIPILSVFLFAWPMAIFSKESGVLLPALLMILEGTLLRLHGLDRWTRRYIFACFALTVVLPFLAVAIYFIIHPEWLLGGYSARFFTLSERLLTEARVVWLYLGLLASPSVSRLGLYHDDIPISHTLWDPVSTLWAITGLIVVTVGAVVVRRRSPIASFGILFFLVGHIMESSIIPLEIAHEHRNYLPSYGILVVGIHFLLKPTVQPRINQLKKLATLIIIAGFGLVTGLRANLWGDPIEYLLADTRYHPDSPRTNYEAGRFLFFMCLKETHPEVRRDLCGRAETLFARAYANDPSFLAGPIAVLRTKDFLGQEPSSEEIKSLRHALATKKMSRFTPMALAILGQCVRHGDCHLAWFLIDDLFVAALSNPTMDQDNVGALYNERAVLAHSNGDIESATRYNYIAARTAPRDAQIGLNLVYLLLSSGKLAEAESEIRHLRQLWIDPVIAEQLSIREKELEQLRSTLVTPPVVDDAQPTP